MSDAKTDVLKRLAYIEGHLKGIRRMVEADQYCVDILKQTYAVKRAIDNAKTFVDSIPETAQPAADKASAYAKHVYEIASETGAEISRIIEKQFSEGNRQLTAAIEAMARNAPVGSEGVVTLVKSAVTAANSAFDQVNKATRQVVEMTEANVANVANATNATRAAGKRKAA